jgi:type II secretory pathway pseudopilin PulG
MTDERGFLLVEVLVATAVTALIFGVLISWTTQNLAALSRARERQTAALLAEQRARELQFTLSEGANEGIEGDTFEPPDDAWAWESVIEPLSLPLPADYDRDTAPSPLFDPPESARGAKPAAVMQRVQVRVFRTDDPERTDLVDPPLVFVAVQRGQPMALDPATGQPVPAGAAANGPDGATKNGSNTGSGSRSSGGRRRHNPAPWAALPR